LTPVDGPTTICAMGVEYATITAALSILASSLGGTLGSVLPSSTAKGASLVASVARSHHVSTVSARAAYEKASFTRPELRYLYAVGWISSSSDLARCKAAQLLGPDPAVASAQALRASPKAMTALRHAHITLAQAAAALGRGLTDGCA
jgi:hypothetical protein